MQGSQIWLLVAVGGGVLFVLGAAPFVKRLLPAHDVASRQAAAELAGLPPTALQKRARWSFFVGTVVGVAIFAALAQWGPAELFANRSLRLPLLGLFMASVVAHALVLSVARPRRSGPERLDERDRLILTRAPALQSVAVVVSLALWSIVLEEVYSDAGAVPLQFPFLIFVTTFIVQMLALAGGILVGYRQVDLDAQG